VVDVRNDGEIANAGVLDCHGEKRRYEFSLSHDAGCGVSLKALR
jgi:hypothetical protein